MAGDQSQRDRAKKTAPEGGLKWDPGWMMYRWIDR